MHRPGPERCLVGLVAVRRAVVPGLVVKDEFPRRGALHGEIQSPDLLEDRGWLRPRVLQEEGPFDGGEVVVLDRPTPHDQAGAWIGPREEVLGPLVVDLVLMALPVPGWKQGRRGPPAVDQGEEPWSLAGSGYEVLADPLVLAADLLRGDRV